MGTRLCVLLLLVTGGTYGQDGPEGGTECEETLQYMEFLKVEVTEVVDRVLQETLYEAKSRLGQVGLEETLRLTMEQVMLVRESLLGRIRAIRRGEGEKVAVCPEQGIGQEEQLSELRRRVMDILLKLVESGPASLGRVREVSQLLLKLKLAVQNEAMRLLLLPQGGGPRPARGGCGQCAGLQEILGQLERLEECAGQEPIQDIDLPQGGSPVVRPSGRASCPPAAMYSMDLIAITERIDSEIKTLYNLLVIETKETDRTKLVLRLEFYKLTRAGVEELISQLLGEADDAGLRRAALRGLRRLTRSVEGALSQCGTGCGRSSCGCGGAVVREGLAKMEEYTAVLGQGEGQAAREFLRADLIQVVQGNNQAGRDILIRKATEGALEDCEQQQLEVYGATKGPYWMLVNATIFSPSLEELGVMVATMREVLEGKLEQYCGPEDRPRPAGGQGPSCQWAEYEATEQYLEKLDSIIQDSLFKPGEEEERREALLGFLDMQQLLETRVKELFEGRLRCLEEVDVIKKQFMPGLTRCLGELMNPRVPFSRMTRRQRMGCSKDLRGGMEERVSGLLREELRESIQLLNTGPPAPPAFLTDPDSPITDIDLPAGGAGGLARPEEGRSAAPGARSRSPPLRAAGLLCGDGATLLSLDRVCDGTSDCPEGEDEDEC